MLKRLLLAVMAAIALASAAVAQTSDLTSTPLRPYSLRLDAGTKTATATAGAATLNKSSGIITSESLTTAAGATYTLTITDSSVAAADEVFASVALGTSTTGLPSVATVKAGAGTITIVVRNAHASAAFNGTIAVTFMVLKI